MKKRLYLLQVISYTAVMLSISYTPRIAEQLHATIFEISLLFSFYNLAYFLSSIIFGRLADIKGRRIFIISGFLFSSIAFLLQYFYRDYYSLLLLRVLAGFAAGIFPAAIVSLAHDIEMKMGKLSAFGALGWAIGSYLAGVLSLFYPFKMTYVFSSIVFFIAFAVSLTLPESHVRLQSIPLFPIKIIKRNWALYASYILRHSAATMIWAYWPIFVKSIGGNSFWQAATMGINSTVQFFLMYFYMDIRRYPPLVIIGLGLSSLTFLGYAFTRNIWMLIPMQALLAASWSFLYVGSLRYLTDRNPEKATATGLLNSSIGISAFLGPIIGGAYLYEIKASSGIFLSYFGLYRSLMILSFILSFVGFILFFATHRREILLRGQI